MLLSFVDNTQRAKGCSTAGARGTLISPVQLSPSAVHLHTSPVQLLRAQRVWGMRPQRQRVGVGLGLVCRLRSACAQQAPGHPAGSLLQVTALPWAQLKPEWRVTATT